MGIDAIVNLIFSLAPKYSDEYYAQRAREAAKLDVLRICLKDPGGLLCPCFGVKAADIVEDARAGRKERIKDLKERAGGPEARCLTACPDGQPCLPLALRLFRENFSA